MAMSNGIGSVLQETKKDPLGDFAKRKVAESDARMKKMNPKGRKLDKNGNPIVTKEELAKSGMSLGDFLNRERGLKRRDGSKPDITAPMQGPAVKANPMADQEDTDKRVMMGEARKRAAAPLSRGNVEADYKMKMKDIIKDKANQEREEQYGSSLKMGGKVKGYKVGGSPGMHRMPDGKMMKDSAHKKHGGKVKKLSRGGGIAVKGLGKGRMC